MSILFGLLLMWGGILAGVIALFGRQWHIVAIAIVAIFFGWLLAKDQ